MGLQADLAGQWVKTLKELSPNISRIALYFDPATAATMWPIHLRAAKSAALPLGIEVFETPVAQADEIERTMANCAKEPNSGVIVVPSPFAFSNRKLIIAAAEQHKIPTIYGIVEMVRSGGLISHGPDLRDQWESASSLVDRILRGTKPGDLPVQISTKLTLAINAKTARAISVAVPSVLRARADEVIE
jgi:putative tryptophan/tyrosine transport system substrate-binding protein